jgi:hypothetical protein
MLCQEALFHFQIIHDFVVFALPCRLHCLRLVFASRRASQSIAAALPTE